MTAQPMPGDTLSIALEILKAHPDWYLFPIRRLEKTPPLFKDELDANNSNDPKKIRQWHARYLGCNWGIALKKSKLIVVDVDTKPGKVGEATLADLEFTYGLLPDTLTVRTPSGGLHIYFNEANGVVHRMAVSGFGKDVDSTNYVLTPGCWLSSGGTYEIIKDEPVAPSPAWFATLINKPEQSAVVQTPEVELDTRGNVAWAINYLQNDAPPCLQGSNGEFTLLMVCGVLKDRGISLTMGIELLDQYYNVFGKCDPLWSLWDGPKEDRLDVKAQNAWNYLTKSAPGAATAEAEFFPDVFDDEQKEYVVALARRDQAAYNEKLSKRRSEAERTINEVPADEVPPAPEDTPALPGEIIRSLLPGGARASLVSSPVATLDDSRVRNFDDICRRWVWITGIERFVNRVDPTVQWKQTQFDSEYNRFLKAGAGSSASKYLFKEEQTRIQRFRYMAFRPGREEFINAEYNVWRPGAIQPVAGDTSIWNEHINNLFQDENDRDAILNWMAWIVQNPTKKPNNALLLVGRMTGTGKSFVARVLEQIIGERNTQRPKNSSMGGDFNSWLKDCRLCIIEEVHQVNRRENFNALRDLITEPFCEVNIKGIPAFKIPNYVCMMGVSNHPDALPLDDNDRRWLVVETYAQPRDAAYYRRLFACLPDEFGAPPTNPDLVPAVYAELMARDLGAYTGFDRPVMTKAKERMIQQSRNDAETWLLENVSNIPLSRDIVTIQDVKDAMPTDVQRTVRLTTTTIPNFLRDKLNGNRLMNARRLSNGQRVHFWLLRGLEIGDPFDKTNVKKLRSITDNQLVVRYEAQRKMDNRVLDESAESDFGEDSTEID